MIDRYTLPEMGALWSEETKFQKWLEVEIAICEVHAEMGTIPGEALGSPNGFVVNRWAFGNLKGKVSPRSGRLAFSSLRQP